MTEAQKSKQASIDTAQDQINRYLCGFEQTADGRKLAIARTKFEEAFLWLGAAIKPSSSSGEEGK